MMFQKDSQLNKDRMIRIRNKNFFCVCFNFQYEEGRNLCVVIKRNIFIIYTSLSH